MTLCEVSKGGPQEEGESSVGDNNMFWMQSGKWKLLEEASSHHIIRGRVTKSCPFQETQRNAFHLQKL